MMAELIKILALLPAVVTDETVRRIGQAPVSAPAVPMEGGGLWLTMLRMIVALCFVLGLVAALGWALRRWAPAMSAAARGAGKIDILATRPLGLRRSLILARVRGRVVLLGATPQQISALAEWEDEPSWAGAEPPGGESAARAEAMKSFDSILAARQAAESGKAE